MSLISNRMVVLLCFQLRDTVLDGPVPPLKLKNCIELVNVSLRRGSNLLWAFADAICMAMVINRDAGRVTRRHVTVS
jgi:hypothetical protein